MPILLILLRAYSCGIFVSSQFYFDSEDVFYIMRSWPRQILYFHARPAVTKPQNGSGGVLTAGHGTPLLKRCFRKSDP